MKSRLTVFLFTFIVLCVSAAQSFAQTSGTVSAVLHEKNSGDPVGYATVSLTAANASKPSKYVVSGEDGSVKIDNVKNGTYTLKVELLGYETFVKEISVSGSVNLGILAISEDKEVLDAAKVSDVGNPIIIKKDTIEYNASSFKTTENDVLADLLKKLPGVEVDENGAVTANGESVTKVYIDGKTFFMDDPALATKNIPAKLVNKVKVVKKKSEQAAFTGIDDGKEETVLDLSVQPSMMKGLVGNVMLGAGHDIPTESSPNDDFRYQTTAFLGNFKKSSQLSIIVNANNANSRGFTDRAGGMMGGMMGGGGPMGGGGGGFGGSNGIINSYMAGINGGRNFFDDRMQFTGNYMFNGSNTVVEEDTYQENYYTDFTRLNNTRGNSTTNTYGNRVGFRLEHKFSEKSSILFEPQINFGRGNYTQGQLFDTRTDYLNGVIENTNDGFSVNSGDNHSVSTSGFFMYRQRLGIPGRTLTANLDYSFSNNETAGFTQSLTNTYASGSQQRDIVNQRIDQSARSLMLSGRVNYTEPMGNNFYVEGNYSYSYNKSTSDKSAYNSGAGAEFIDQDRHEYVYNGEVPDPSYSNSILNEYVNQNMGANLLYQGDKLHAQVGFALQPTKTHNSTSKGVAYQIDTTFTVVNWSPTAMILYDLNDKTNMRFFYRGRSSQPSTSQLMPVPDNSNPINVSLGNPSLAPYFSHSLNGDIRFSNRQNFSSFNLRFNGGIVQNAITNAVMATTGGTTFNMPYNGPATLNGGVNFFGNLPIAKSNFSVNTSTGFNGSASTSYVGKNLDLSTYWNNGDFDYAGFLSKYPSPAGSSDFVENVLKSLSVTERLTLQYRSDNLELRAGAGTRYTYSTNSISDKANEYSNNQINVSLTWTWEQTGLTFKPEYNYNWYLGYDVARDPEHILNAEIDKLVFRKRATLALKGYDILGQSKNLSVSNSANVYKESLNNTLGRYIIVSFTWRFGTFGGRNGRQGAGPMRGGPMGGGPGGPGAHGGPGGPGGRP